MLKQFWNASLNEIFKSLHSTEEGLSHEDVRLRLKKYGSNSISQRDQSHLLIAFLKKFNNPLVLLLIGAAFLSFVLGERGDFLIILCMILLSVSLDFFQEHRAVRAAKKLKKSIATQATVLRDGLTKAIPIEDLVPGDLVLLSAGDLIPADGRLLEARHLYVNQAILTGESYPVEKNAVTSRQKREAVDALNSVFMGTSVLTGDGKMVVCVTGKETLFGQISESLSEAPPPTPFELGTRKFGYLLMKLTVFLVLFVIVANIFILRPWLDTLLFALALAVGMTPEFLPMILSVTLVGGATRLAKEKVIVKRLSAIHDLGSMNVLCTDKTGTLTEAKIELAKHLDTDGKESERVLEIAYLNSFFESGIKSPLDVAILSHESIKVDPWLKLEEIPYDFERRRVSVILENQNDGSRALFIKGAPEDILSLSTHFEDSKNREVLELTQKKREEILALFEAYSEQGFRILGIGWRDAGAIENKEGRYEEAQLVFAGFALFYDPMKGGVVKTIEALRHANIDLKIVTGDNEKVTLHLCKALKFTVRGVLTGSEITHLSEEAFNNKVLNSNLFCRVTPAQKKRIIECFKAQGNVVGYLGDGINDAPSLLSADVGISVDSAADVAREASDLILLKHDLHAVFQGVMEGRRTFANIMKYIRMMTSSNFGNMFSMAGAALFLPFLPMLPLQILLNNFLYDVSETAIPLDSVDEEQLQNPHAWNMKSIVRFMIVMGLISSLFDFVTFFILIKLFQADQMLFQTGWFVESLTTQILIIFVIRTYKPFWKARPHPMLAILSSVLVFVAALIPFTFLAQTFEFVRPPVSFYAVLFMIVCAYLATAEVMKRRLYRYNPF